MIRINKKNIYGIKVKIFTLKVNKKKKLGELNKQKLQKYMIYSYFLVNLVLCEVECRWKKLTEIECEMSIFTARANC